MKRKFILMLLVISKISSAQYYYNDIIANKLSSKQFNLLQTNKFKKVSAKSYDASGNNSTDFFLEQLFNNNFTQSVTNSKIASGISATLITNFENNHVISTNEISKGIENIVHYTYYNDSTIKSISDVSKDTALNISSTENHLWNYATNGKPVSMTCVKNNSDTTTVLFIIDENGNVAEERWSKKGKEIEHYFYYYNQKNELTDIVRFNNRAKKLLPDFLFEYDEQGRIQKMTQVTAANSNYLVWTYLYNAKGLKQTEICINRKKELLGKIEYSYE